MSVRKNVLVVTSVAPQNITTVVHILFIVVLSFQQIWFGIALTFCFGMKQSCTSEVKESKLNQKFH